MRFTQAHADLRFSRRMLLLGGAQAAFGAALLARLGYLSITQHQLYQTKSEDNRVQMIVVPPRRGWIVDRNDKPLAINRSDFRIDIIPDQLEKPEETLRILVQLLDLGPDEVERILKDLKGARGYQPVQVAENVPYEQYAAVTVRLPELPGVTPQRGFSRFYPTGPAVAHLLGYVGAPSAKEYEAEKKNPLLVTPGFKVGKEGLEKTLEPRLRGIPGGQRVELTARGKLVRELEPKPDRSGGTVKLTIDGGLQEYVARRMGLESGALVALDVAKGDVLAYVSMPAYDPNSFSDGIGRTEWRMLSENDHIPLLNKVAQGLYPSGSTIKPAMALAFLKQGIDPNRRVHCPGGIRIGNRYFRCDAVHGSVAMHEAVEKSCNTYFWAMGLVTDPAKTTEMVHYLGYGEKFDLPIPSQRYGTMPNPDWLMKKYDRKWQAYDSANTSIGQGYVLVNPIQLAVMPARLASGKLLKPRLLMDDKVPTAPAVDATPEQMEIIRKAMAAVVNGSGTAVGSKLPIESVQMAGKTGTAQVYRLEARGYQSNWALRDHALFIAFAPVEAPRYAMGCIIEHGGFGASIAAPIIRDSMTYLFDPQRAMDTLVALEKNWGGSLAERTARQAAQYDAIARAEMAARKASQASAP